MEIKHKTKDLSSSVKKLDIYQWIIEKVHKTCLEGKTVKIVL